MNDILALGRNVIETERQGLEALAASLNQSFVEAVNVLTELPGKVVLTGVGKSGLIAKKIAATMASLGTPAMFMHPVDGLHGDLGVILPGDAVIIISNSGNTKEIVDLLEALKGRDLRLIAITGGMDSLLARGCAITLPCVIAREACHLGLAPTTSTTCQLALGDALAVTLATVKGFDRASFRDYHPAGSLGQQLLQCVGEVMLTGERLPWVNRDASLATVLEEMTAKRLGLTLVGTSPAVAGLITDGDLRRALLKHGQAISTVQAAEIMTVKPAIISSSLQAFEALELMESRQITALLVGDDHDHLEGVVHLHDLLGRGRLGFK